MNDCCMGCAHFKCIPGGYGGGTRMGACQTRKDGACLRVLKIYLNGKLYDCTKDRGKNATGGGGGAGGAGGKGFRRQKEAR